MSVSYPTPVAAFPSVRVRPPSAGTAETLILVALVLQAIGGAVLLIGFGVLTGISILNPFAYAWVAVTATAAVSVVVVVFLYLAYTYSYTRVRNGEFQAAKDPTLVIGILSLFAGILPGILYLVGYVKLGDAVREQQGYAPGYGYPAPPAAAVSQVACRSCGRVSPVGQFTFCPGCGQKLAP